MNQAWTKIAPGFIRKRLEGRENLQKIVCNTGWLFTDKILRMGIGLFVGVWLARYLGPDQFGLLSYVTAFVGLFTTIATLGLDSVVIRDIVHTPKHANEIIGTAFLLRLAGAVATVALCVIILSIVRPGEFLTLGLVTIIAAGTFFQALDVIDFWFQSQVASKYTVYARNCAFLTIAAVNVTLILAKAPLIAFAWAILAEMAFGAIGLMLMYRKFGMLPGSWQVSKGRARRLLRDSWPLILSGMVIAVYMKIDQIMLGDMTSNDEVGIYSAAARVSELWYFIPVAVSSSIYPTLIKAYQESEEKLYHHLKIIMGYFFWGALIVSCLTAAFSHQIIALLYGSDYSGAANVLSIHIFSCIIVSMGVIFSQKYIIDGTTRVSLAGAFIGAVINVLLNLWIIPRYGAVGAAISTFISYLCPTLFLGIFVDKRILTTHTGSVFYVLKRKGKVA